MKLAVTFICSILALLSASQCGTLSDEYVLEKAEDYTAQESQAFDIINCLLFEAETFDKKEFDKGMAYAIIWIGGTPDYKVEVETDILTFLEEEPDLLYPYILALTLAQKEKKGTSQLELETEAVNYLYKHYSISQGYSKCKSLERMHKKYQKGKLTGFLESLRNQK